MPDISNMIETTMDEIWVISDGRIVSLDLDSICGETVSGPVTEYRISELARYMLDPAPIVMEEKVIGCKVKYRKPSSGAVKRLIGRIMRRKGDHGDDDRFTEEIISASKIGMPNFVDGGLNNHFLKIKEMLRPFDPVQKKLAGLEKDKIDDISAICGEIGSNRFLLNVKGGINEKIGFIANSISKKTKVTFNKAYFSNGLFEMRGFSFDTFNAGDSYRIIKFTQNNKTRYCVLNANYRFQYWITETALINYMHLFQQSIKIDPKLREALTLCEKGKARPLKVFFSRQLEHNYSEKHLPMIYRKVFNTYKINPDERETITKILNNFQSIVVFNYIPRDASGKQKMYTNISVMHDFRALEPIKGTLPQLYSEINKKSSVSDAGKLYLLDSMRGYQNV